MKRNRRVLPTHIVDKEKQNIGRLFHRTAIVCQTESDERKEASYGNLHSKLVRFIGDYKIYLNAISPWPIHALLKALLKILQK